MKRDKLPRLEGSKPLPLFIEAALHDPVTAEGIERIGEIITVDETLVNYVKTQSPLFVAALSLPSFTTTIRRDGSLTNIDPHPVFLDKCLKEWMHKGEGHRTYKQLVDALPEPFKKLSFRFRFDDPMLPFVAVVIQEIYKTADLFTKQLLRQNVRSFYQLTLPQWNKEMIYTFNNNIFSSSPDDLTLATFYHHAIDQPSNIYKDGEMVKDLCSFRNIRLPQLDLPLKSADEKTVDWFNEYGHHLSEIYLSSLQIRRRSFLDALGELVSTTTCPVLTSLSVNGVVKKQVFHPDIFRNCIMYKTPNQVIVHNLQHVSELHLGISCPFTHHQYYDFQSNFTLPSLRSLSLFCLALPLFDRLTNARCLLNPDKLQNISFSQTCGRCLFPLLELGQFLSTHPAFVKKLAFNKIQISQLRRPPFHFITELCGNVENIEKFVLEVDEGTAYLEDILNPPYHCELDFFNFKSLKYLDFTPFWEWSMERVYLPNLTMIRSMPNLRSLILRTNVGRGDGALVLQSAEYPQGMLEVLNRHRFISKKPMPATHNLACLALDFPNWEIKEKELRHLCSLFPILKSLSARLSFEMLKESLTLWNHIKKIFVIGARFDQILMITLGDKRIEEGEVHVFFKDAL